MSFANQFLALCRLARVGKHLSKTVHELPKEQDQELARLKLGTMGVGIDRLTDAQKRYATDYSAGT